MKKLLIILILLLSGCGATPPGSLSYENQYTIKSDGEATPLNRIVDNEAGVACWWISVQSLECLPISDTKIK